jgi:response regulator NasT
MRRSLRVLAADADPAARDFYQRALTALGHQPHPAGTGRQAIDLCRTVSPDVVIADARLPDADGIELAASVCGERPIPVILTAADPDAATVWGAAECHIVGYLAKPLRMEALGAALAVAVRCFDRLRQAREEADQLRRTLDDRKVIERAKGLLMRFAGLSEDDAYRRMRGLATRGSRKVVEVAREVITAGDVFAGLTEVPDGPGRAHANGRMPALEELP